MPDVTTDTLLKQKVHVVFASTLGQTGDSPRQIYVKKYVMFVEMKAKNCSHEDVIGFFVKSIELNV